MADLDKQGQSMEHLQEMVSVHHHSQRPHASSATYHVFTQQHHFIPKHQIHQLRKHQGTGKSFSEAFILTSTNPQYDKRLFIDLPVQYMKTTSSEHGENMLCTQIVLCFCFDIQNNLCTQHVLPMF